MLDGRFDEGFARALASRSPEPDAPPGRALVIPAVLSIALGVLAVAAVALSGGGP